MVIQQNSFKYLLSPIDIDWIQYNFACCYGNEVYDVVEYSLFRYFIVRQVILNHSQNLMDFRFLTHIEIKPWPLPFLKMTQDCDIGSISI